MTTVDEMTKAMEAMKRYMNPSGPPWNDNQLSLGKPHCMDTPTLIEWIQRQLETPEETLARHKVLEDPDAESVDIYSAGQAQPIIKIRNGVMTPNEMRQLEDTLLQKDKFGRRIMFLPDETLIEYIKN